MAPKFACSCQKDRKAIQIGEIANHGTYQHLFVCQQAFVSMSQIVYHKGAVFDTTFVTPVDFTVNETLKSELFGMNFLDFSLLAKYHTKHPFTYYIGGRISRATSDFGAVIRRSVSQYNNEELNRLLANRYWKTQYALSIGTNIRLSRRWSMDFRYNQGLLDITPDDLYQEKANHLNSDVQVSFRFHL